MFCRSTCCSSWNLVRRASANATTVLMRTIGTAAATSTARPVNKVLVVGAGAIGLRTALELLQRNVAVILQAPQHPIQSAASCSQGAGGLWMPFHCNDPRTDIWAAATLDELLTYAAVSNVHLSEAHQLPQHASDPDYGNLVEILPVVTLKRAHSGPTLDRHHHDIVPAWTRDSRLQFQHLTVEMLAWQNVVYRWRIPPEQELLTAGYLHAWSFQSPVVNAPAMLEYLLWKISTNTNAQVQLDDERLRYGSIADMRLAAAKLGCDTVVNCTGLGPRTTLQPPDLDLVAGRGILLQYDRQACPRREPVSIQQEASISGMQAMGLGLENIHDAVIMVEEPPWGSVTHPCYMIPRGDTIVVGGTYLEYDMESTIRPEERQQLLQNAHWMGIDTSQAAVIGEWVGFRPYRQPVRCEWDQASLYDGGTVRVFHSYGYGGSGWTVNVGAAQECTDQLVGVAASGTGGSH